MPIVIPNLISVQKVHNMLLIIQCYQFLLEFDTNTVHIVQTKGSAYHKRISKTTTFPFLVALSLAILKIEEKIFIQILSLSRYFMDMRGEELLYSLSFYQLLPLAERCAKCPVHFLNNAYKRKQQHNKSFIVQFLNANFINHNNQAYYLSISFVVVF